MLKLYPNLYVGENAKKKQKTIIRKLKSNAGMLDVFLLTFAANEKDVFDIISSAYLKQKSVRKNIPMIVGIAVGYEEAVDLAVSIIEEIYQKTGDIQIRSFLMEEIKRKRM